MNKRFLERMGKLEERILRSDGPRKLFLPRFLIENLESQGVRFSEDYCDVDWASLKAWGLRRDKAAERADPLPGDAG